jgi:hypothetical protein
MTNQRRRRLVQAGASLPLLGLANARSQERNLSATRRKPGAAIAGAASLVLAPKHALIIGNSGYGFAPLKNPANDARAISEELKRTGFQVTVGLDLTRQQMIDAIRAYGESLNRSKAVGMFYYAGHGLQLAWRNYLVPTDASISKVEDIQAKCVDVNAVIEGIAKAANPMNVVILDACRENPFGDVKLDQKGLSQLDAPVGTLLAYATAPGNLASDGDGANGLYTENLLREMQVPEAKIEDVFKRVRLAVRRRSNGRQIPWESTSLEEDFWFIPPKEIQKVAEAARQEAENQSRREQLERLAREQLERRRKEEESERAFREELALWEKVANSTEPGPLEDYLRRYPRGRFAEICVAQLDRILERQGEKKVEIASQAQNPYTQGSADVDIRYQPGDSYTYNVLDPYSKVVSSTFTITVTKVTDQQVIYNDGQVISDLLGNPLRRIDGREFTAHQEIPRELVIGKRWSTRFVARTRNFGDFDTGLESVVAAKEKVVVPAGTFECYRIDGGGEATGRGVIRIEHKIWLAPQAVRQAVAWQTLRFVAGRTIPLSERFELVSFKQA